MKGFWAIFNFLLNALLFGLVGLQLEPILDQLNQTPGAKLIGYAALLSLSYIAARNLATPKRGATLALAYTAPLPLMAVWMTRVLETDVVVQNAPTVHGGLRAHLVTLFTQLSGLDASTFLINLVVASAVLLGPVIAGLRPSRAPERWLPLAVGLGSSPV